MPTYTQNYSLHQWEDTDDFLRSDFNEDFSKIDTALGAMLPYQAAVENNSYNIYNLMLQNYYDGKYTGYKKAMLFDGFMDDSGVASLGTGMYLNTSDGRVELDNLGQQTVTQENYGNTRSMSYYDTNNTISFYVTTTGYGTLSEFRLYMTGTVSYYFYSTSGTTTTLASGSSYSNFTTSPLTISLNHTVNPGETYKITLYYSTTPAFYGSSSSTSVMPGCEFYFIPTYISQGTLTLPTADLGAFSQVLAWSNYNAGDISFSINGETMTQTTEQDSSTLNETTCLESAHQLDITGTGDTVISITMNAPDETQMYLYDYGLVFL